MLNSKENLKLELVAEINRLEELRQQMKDDIRLETNRILFEELSQMVKIQKGKVAALSEAVNKGTP
ncbi:hypothetical protein [Salinithrix halophila]|uniref:Uncharacterized protein n=1 Tax=Salinithrix halophila TaxID=1485204 RepID=A0ABV8JGY2_9BACL